MDFSMEQSVPDGFALAGAQNVMRGAQNGIELLILPKLAESQYQIQLYADLEKSGSKKEFLEFLGALQQRHPYVTQAGCNGANMVSVHVSSAGWEDKENLSALVSELTLKCRELGVHSCCAHCKNALPLSGVSVDNMPLLVCDSCLSQMMRERNGKPERRENPLLGIIGALGGVLLGSVLWVLIGQLGFIAGIAGFAIVFCGMKGYEILGGKLSRMGIAICVLFSCLVIVAAEFFSLGLVIYKELSPEYIITLGEAFGLVPELLKEPEVAAEVGKDLVIGYALAIWASFSNIKNAWSQVKAGNEQHTIVPF